MFCRFYIGSWNMSGYLNEGKPVRTLRDIIHQMRTAYCSTIGFEVRCALFASYLMTFACWRMYLEHCMWHDLCGVGRFATSAVLPLASAW